MADKMTKGERIFELEGIVEALSEQMTKLCHDFAAHANVKDDRIAQLERDNVNLSKALSKVEQEYGAATRKIDTVELCKRLEARMTFTEKDALKIAERVNRAENKLNDHTIQLRDTNDRITKGDHNIDTVELSKRLAERLTHIEAVLVDIIQKEAAAKTKINLVDLPDPTIMVGIDDPAPEKPADNYIGNGLCAAREGHHLVKVWSDEREKRALYLNMRTLNKLVVLMSGEGE